MSKPEALTALFAVIANAMIETPLQGKSLKAAR